jgi:hypothetical protein
MLKITCSDMQCYMECPRKYILSRSISVRSNDDVYNKALRSAINYFWTKHLNGELISMAELKKRWEILYPYRNSYAIDGFNELYNFYLLFGNRDYSILAINLERNIKFSNGILVARMELIRKTHEGIELVVLKPFRSKQLSIPSDITVASSSLAFRQMSNKEEIRTIVHDIKHNKIFHLKCNESNFTRLEETFQGVANGIINSVYPPRYPCLGCKYRKYCYERRL